MKEMVKATDKGFFGNKVNKSIRKGISWIYN